MIEEKLHNWRLRDARMSSDKERGEKQVVCPFLLLATINVAVVVDLAHVVCFLVCECALRVVWDRDGRGGGGEEKERNATSCGGAFHTIAKCGVRRGIARRVLDPGILSESWCVSRSAPLRYIPVNRPPGGRRRGSRTG